LKQALQSKGEPKRKKKKKRTRHGPDGECPLVLVALGNNTVVLIAVEVLS